jgi:TatD DNase family protein
VPSGLLLVETDAPFLAPDPFRGKPNRPALLPNTAKTLAGVRSMPIKPLIDLVSANAVRAFGLY